MNCTAPILFAELSARPGLAETLKFQATGLVVVFGALALIWVLLEIMGAIFRQRSAHKIVLPAPSSAAASPDSDEFPAGVVAAIAAAVHITLRGQPHQITSIKASKNSSNWAAEGRREHFSSHRVR